jgi:alkyl hydroperoxide reductase subunit AhpC
LKKIYAKYHNEEFEIIGVSVDQKLQKEEWKKTIAKYSLPWVQYWDIDGKKAAELNIIAYPTNFLLDENGIIIAKNIDPITLEKLLEKIFGK